MRKAKRDSAPHVIAVSNVQPTSATPQIPKESAIDSPIHRPDSAAAQATSRKRRTPEPTRISPSSAQSSTEPSLDSVLIGAPEPPCPETKRRTRKKLITSARDVRALIPV